MQVIYSDIQERPSLAHSSSILSSKATARVETANNWSIHHEESWRGCKKMQNILPVMSHRHRGLLAASSKQVEFRGSCQKIIRGCR